MSESCSRFIALYKPIDDYILKRKNKTTWTKTRRDVSLLSEFLKLKDETRSVEEIQPDGLNKYLRQKKRRPSSQRGPISSFNHQKEGKGSKPKVAKALSDKEVNLLYKENLLGISSAEALMLWLFNTLSCGS